jgi:septal ring factor EnvC (AmiA/AmiB activator)
LQQYMNKTKSNAQACSMLVLLLLWLMAIGCVSKKQYNALVQKTAQSQANSELEINRSKAELVDAEKQGLELRQELKGKQAEINTVYSQVKLLQEQQDYLKKTNANLLERLSELSVLNKTGAENMKKTLDAIDKQGKIIISIQEQLAKQDSLNLKLIYALNDSIPLPLRKQISWEIEQRNFTVYQAETLVEDKPSQALLFRQLASFIKTNPSLSLQIITQKQSVIGEYAMQPVLWPVVDPLTEQRISFVSKPKTKAPSLVQYVFVHNSAEIQKLIEVLK